jgi:4-diphosphocytidyl-2C-methyl-D-erythritol kinase
LGLGFLFGASAATTALAADRAGAGLPAAAGAAGAGAAAFFPLPLPAAALELAGTIASLASCLANRDLRRPALLRCRMPFDAARSKAWIASKAIANLSDSATGPPVSVRRALTTFVFTSERTARLRAARRTPERACFFADAVRLATCGLQEGEEHEARIIEASGVRTLLLAVPARAKLNLDLEVLSRGSDGFHNVRTHLQAIALHDLLELAPAKSTTIEATGLPVSCGSDNSVLKAHEALERAAGRKLPTRFELHKRIPSGAGLGGASSDAAAALRGLSAIHALKNVDLAEVAANLGADVPFFLNGGAALAEGRGERLTPLRSEPGWFAIAWPGIELLTAAVYRAWDEVKGDGANQLQRAAGHVAPQVQDFAVRLGDGWQMTGSGSAFFLRCADQQAASKATAQLDCWTAVTHAVGAWA